MREIEEILTQKDGEKNAFHSDEEVETGRKKRKRNSKSRKRKKGRMMAFYFVGKDDDGLGFGLDKSTNLWNFGRDTSTESFEFLHQNGVIRIDVASTGETTVLGVLQKKIPQTINDGYGWGIGWSFKFRLDHVDLGRYDEKFLDERWFGVSEELGSTYDTIRDMIILRIDRAQNEKRLSRLEE
ncbi:hypothetical protein Tco_0529547 [Tanacetum coccineum]